MPGIATEKAAARKAAFARRATAHSEQSSRAGAERLLGYLSRFRGRPVSGYMPIRTEIDPLYAMAEMTRFGHVGVPIVLGEGQPLEFHRWDASTPMIAGPFGALVPITPEVVIPELVVLPLVAFDAAGYRLGYGGGFYDRTLELLRKRGPVLAVGFAYAAQQADDLPVEPTDQRLDAIVTETGVVTF
ncbi:MAG: 5-formyltetrahydrofolate cyclo-ligase [Paracoccaceae bacterium]